MNLPYGTGTIQKSVISRGITFLPKSNPSLYCCEIRTIQTFKKILPLANKSALIRYYVVQVHSYFYRIPI